MLAHIDSARQLNDILRIRKQGYSQNNNDNCAGYEWEPRVGKYDKFDDEPNPNDVMNEGEHIEDVECRRLGEQAEQEVFPRLKFSKLSFSICLI